MIDQKEIGRLTKLAGELLTGLAALQDTQAPGPIAAPLVSIWLHNKTELEQHEVPFTVGQVFKEGALAADSKLVGHFAGTDIALQADVKVKHPDGSVRFAIVSGIVPKIEGHQAVEIGFVPARESVAAPEKRTFLIPKINVVATIAGVEYTANPSELIKLGTTMKWLQGELMDETQVSMPLHDKLRNKHPHLHARFAIRAYANGETRVDTTVENTWAYAPNPQNFKMDLRIEIDGRTRYNESITQWHHSRLRRVFWTDATPGFHVEHDAQYLMDTGAVDIYDMTKRPNDKMLDALLAEFNDPNKFGTMRVGLAFKDMKGTGGRRDIGVLPGWDVAWLLSQDERAQKVAQGTADQAGSWPMHYRDQETDRPLSIIDYPYATKLGNASGNNPVKKRDEKLPAIPKADADAVPHAYENAHHPSLGYFAFLMTGDYFYLEEVQFAAAWTLFWSNPGYREREKGLIHRTQVRGQAWSMRTLFEAAYITPDDDPLKAQFAGFVGNNLEQYNATFSNNPNANKLGVLNNEGAYAYPKSGPLAWSAVSTWQDSFFTWAIGQGVRMGFKKAMPLLMWKIQFVIGRYIGEGVMMPAAVGADDSGAYMTRPPGGAPEFATFREAYAATVGPDIAKLKTADEVAKALKIPVGSMKGYASTDHGYPSNDQPALAHAARVSADGLRAWEKFMTRSQIPKYDASQVYAVVPNNG